MNNTNKWKKYDKKVINFEKSIIIPNWRLDSVPKINLKRESDFEKIPNTGGCYWIWTNERICIVYTMDQSQRNLRVEKLFTMVWQKIMLEVE